MSKEKIKSRWLFFGKDKYTYDTIDELVNKSMGLAVGEIVTLNGYYSADDGATHKRVIADTDDGSGVQLRSGKWANIVHNGEVNVSWFGAKGDGVTDDTNIMQKAIDEAQNKKFKLKMSSRSFLIKKSLIIRKGLFLEGETLLYDGLSTKLILQSNEDIPLVNTPEYDGVGPTVSAACRFKDLYLVNQNYSQQAEENTKNTGFKLNATTECLFENITIIGFNKAFELNKIQINTARNITGYYNNIVFDCNLGSTFFLSNSNFFENNTMFNNIGNYTIQTTHMEDWKKFMIINNNKSVISTTSFKDCSLVSKVNTEPFITVNNPINNLYFESCFIRNNSIQDLIKSTSVGNYIFKRCYVFGIKNYINSTVLASVTFETEKTDSTKYDGSGAEKPTDATDSAVAYYNLNDGALKLNTGIELGYKRKNNVDQLTLDGATGGIRWYTKNLGDYLVAFLQTGTTSQRPVRVPGLHKGVCYFDTDLNAPVWWNGSAWVNSLGAFATNNKYSHLNTLYIAEKMKQEGVYNDFIMYMDDKVAYDKEQQQLAKERKAEYQKALEVNPDLIYEEWLSQQPKLLPYTEEPRPTSALQKFMDKYL